MATYTTNLKLAKPATAERDWGTMCNSNADGLDRNNGLADLFVSLAEVPSASLHVRVAPGVYVRQDGTVGSYAGSASQAIPASTTRVLYLDASGTLTVAASYPSTAHTRLATVVAGASTITSITDDRVLATTCGSFADGVHFTFGTVVGTQLGTSPAEKLAFYGATPIAQRAGSAQASVDTTAATNVSPYGFATAAQADAIVTLLNEIRATLVALGLFKGSA
jgi:hypothetical protein